MRSTRGVRTWMAAAAMGLFVAIAAGEAAAKEKKVPLDQVPQVVKDAAAKAVPGIELTSAVTEIEKGKLVYELNGKANGKSYEVEVSEDGKVLEVEEGDDDGEDDDDEKDDD